jgi:predicted O-linked N-acetylglucosamine transferase (SPINDLY family)
MTPTSVPDTAEAALARARALYRAGQYAAGERATAQATAAHPRAADLWNLHGVMLRQLRRPAEALAALDRALALQAGHPGAQSNRAGVVLDLARTFDAAGDPEAALAALDEGLARDPENLGLLEAKALILRGTEDLARARAFVEALAQRRPEVAFGHIYLADLIGEAEPERALIHLRCALALEPQGLGARIALAHRLSHMTGPEEGGHLDEAHALSLAVAETPGLNANQLKVLALVFARCCDFASFERLGDFTALGRRWAEGRVHTALLLQLARVKTRAERVELVEQHRICGRSMVAEADRRPIHQPRPRPPATKLRLGFLSSDLRDHPVGYFVEPLFEHLDPARFELFCYGFDDRPPDRLQRLFAGRATGFRQMPQASARQAAQAIADDDLDMLVELGGSTAKNKLDVVAYRPAPRQASWLGYPHSAGVAAIDGLICDRFNVPPDRSLLLERPLMLPRSWIAVGQRTFSDAHAVDPELPEARSGVLTFGTANNPYKYTPQVLRTWAEITGAVPDARFAFIRPEGASQVFRANILAAFAAAGVGPERVAFQAVRGGHLTYYNDIDITLDTFPLTGGTTTVEALWMGAPVVSLRGEAFYERLSWSILANVGLTELAAGDLEGYRAAALALAADRDRRTELRRTLRDRVRASPLGDRAGFARDFYALIEDTVR